MIRVRIYNKGQTKHIDVSVKDPADARTLMNILAKNDVPCVLHGGDVHKEK